MQRIVKLCFYLPLAINLLNIQAFVSKFLSAGIAQIIAYSNVGIILIGSISLIKHCGRLPKLVQFWIAYFLCYFAFGLMANAIHGTQPEILRLLIPFIYLFGYAIFLGTLKESERLSKVLSVLFFISCILLIIFNYTNFSLDHDGVYEYTLERAGGVYGDANNAAVAAILSFLFINHSFNPKKGVQRLLKIISLAISVYALFITFSKTGLVVFLLVFFISYSKQLFRSKNVVFSILLIPLIISAALTWASSTTSLSVAQKDRLDNVVNILTFQTDKVSFSSRDVLFKNMMEYIYESPYIGNGLNFGVEIRGHNTIFGVWADAGLFTFLVFLWLLFAYFKKALSENKQVNIFALSVLFTLTVFMLSLQTIINQGYLIVVFVLLGFFLEKQQQGYHT